MPVLCTCHLHVIMGKYQSKSKRGTKNPRMCHDIIVNFVSAQKYY